MPEDNKQTYGIAAALSEALEAAVFADNNAAQKAYSMIEKYAYGEIVTEEEKEGSDGKMAKKTETVRTTELAMADFTIYDADGTPRMVSIPKITMVPLPLLHVTEATFDIEMTASIVNSAETETRMDPNAATQTVTDEVEAPTRRIIRPDRVVVGRRQDGTAIYGTRRPVTTDNNTVSNMRPSTATATNMQMAVTKKSSESNASTINMKVNVKLEQAELPDGIKLLLQAAANSLQVTANGLK